VNLDFLGANVSRHPHPTRTVATGRRPRVVDDRRSRRPDDVDRPTEVTVNWPRAPRSLLRPKKRTHSAISNEWQTRCGRLVVVDRPQIWIFVVACLRERDRLAGVVGSEYTGTHRPFLRPPDVEILTHAPLVCQPRSSWSDATYYASTTPHRADRGVCNRHQPWISKLGTTVAHAPGPGVTPHHGQQARSLRCGPAGPGPSFVSNGATSLHPERSLSGLIVCLLGCAANARLNPAGCRCAERVPARVWGHT